MCVCDVGFFKTVLDVEDDIRWDVHCFQCVQVCGSVSQMLTEEARHYILSPSWDMFYRNIILDEKVYVEHAPTSFPKWVMNLWS